jgi:hypothetical protein
MTMSTYENDDGPEPCCKTEMLLDRNQWERIDDLSEQLLAFRDGCQRPGCYPDNDDGPEPGDTVVQRKARGSAQPKLHRPADSTHGP